MFWALVDAGHEVVEPPDKPPSQIAEELVSAGDASATVALELEDRAALKACPAHKPCLVRAGDLLAGLEVPGCDNAPFIGLKCRDFCIGLAGVVEAREKHKETYAQGTVLARRDFKKVGREGLHHA